MEFDSNGNYNGKMLEVPVPRLLPSHITVVDAETIRRSSQRHKNALEVIIDNFGKRSAVAQGLGAVITTMQKLLCSDHRLYIHRSERTVNGILKVGKKHLFIRDASADKMHEIEPMCVLDFYVHESLQKRGIGRQLFDEMLAREKVQPHMLGYDRPSPKLLSFLRKHFSLMDFEPQANNFVVFRSYFRASSSNSKENLHAANVTDRQYRQRSDGNFISSNNFFLGGRGSSHASQHANWSRRGHHGMPPPSAPAVMGKQVLGDGESQEKRRLDDLDSLSLFARGSQFSADAMPRRREDVNNIQPPVGRNCNEDVSLQEKATNHFMSLQVGRRPASGRAACVDSHLPYEGAQDSRLWPHASSGSHGRDAIRPDDRWRTANSEIGSHLKLSQTNPRRHDDVGEILARSQLDSQVPLPTAARFDRRLGNRIW
mmetsp:Transcript_15973/g.53482  ORF Transcript_15973/g.53482 Transcript_15973/m.53482 type:complete len:428 (+) Transcript_15973:233-1516(+)